MNKRMRELLAQMEQKRQLAKGYMDGETKDVAKATSILDEVEDLQKEFEVEKRLYQAEKDDVDPDEIVKNAEKAAEKVVDGFMVIAKKLQNVPLDEKEKALIIGGTSGEDYLIPEDVQLAINELRRTFLSAKDIVTVTPVTTLKGSTNWEQAETIGLTAFEDGEAIDSTGQPSFTRKGWAVSFYGKIIPISNLLQGAEKASLLAYIKRWFIKNAIFTENQAIFAKLIEGKTVKAIKGWEALKKSINVDLDPALLNGALIVTNQTGFSILDEEKFADGRPVLTADPAKPTQKLFQGLPIKVYPDAQLPQVGSKSPIFYGNTKEGVEFLEYQSLQFATSSDYLFNVNQTAIRVIEGFDVVQNDVDAYIYGTFEATPAPTTAG